jgi:NADP-dependent 3-hydroxy acid dehydrogenase YdfG
VTGAGGGIGAVVCKRFAEEGCSIVAADVNADVLQKLAEEVALSGVGALEPVTADISTDEGDAQLVEVATAHFGGLDVFHADAAVHVMGGLDGAQLDDRQKMFRTNLYGVASGLRQALPELRARGGGSLIITASVLGLLARID